MLALSKYFDSHRPEVLAGAVFALVALALARIAILSWGVRRNRSFDRLSAGRNLGGPANDNGRRAA
jgi:hypothetical protein